MDTAGGSGQTDYPCMGGHMYKYKFALNTNFFKSYTRPEIVECALKAGLDGIEWGLPDIDHAKTAAKEMKAVTSGTGLEIVSYINGGHLWKTDVIRRWSEAVVLGEGKILRVAHPWLGWNLDECMRTKETFKELFSKARTGLEKLDDLHREFGIRYVLEIHRGSVASSAAVCAQLMDGLDPATVGIIYDPANSITEGFIRPRSAVELLGPYLSYVHAKNIIFRYSGAFVPGKLKRLAYETLVCAPQCGMLDWVEVFFALKLAGYSGWISLEEFFKGKTIEENAAEIKEAVSFLKEAADEAKDGLTEPFLKLNE